MNSQPNKSRALKVELAGNVWRRKTFPKIRLQGKWLEQLGFKPNGRVRIVPLEEGESVATRLRKLCFQTFKLLPPNL
jgi:hypothetical protein